MYYDYWLNEGELSQVTELIKKNINILKQRLDEKFDDPSLFNVINETSRFVFEMPIHIEYYENPRNNYERQISGQVKDDNFRVRSADRILREGVIPSCSDYGLLFRTFMIAQGIPTSIYDAFHVNYLFGKEFHGRVFSRVFKGNNVLIINPQRKNAVLSTCDFEILPYVPVFESLDFKDSGIDSYEKMHKFKEDNMSTLLKVYEKNMHKKFIYDLNMFDSLS
ncbi:hypothetical protein K9L97_03715 [Candidatus Woesearchaeota archaeon]|nr:hypothetical protein [Candidatus Woesearchaeota archaeon]